ncbi:MAG: M67 family metallopeptidase [Deltaproteobacteria bacterium]|jgi:proteasome lid subunit RPN8/RPN11|nr:M67 family metallopeptidase [Deltaproteobacteria bacterium]
MKLVLAGSARDLIVSHSLSVRPLEGCGLIAGSVNDGVKKVAKAYVLKNLDQSRVHFTVDQREQLSAVRDMRALGLAPLGNFHSHPDTPARPSEEDVRLSFDPAASYLILSLAGPEPVLKSFRVDRESGAVEEEPIEIGEG